jgi:hypothetical protein
MNVTNNYLFAYLFFFLEFSSWRNQGVTPPSMGFSTLACIHDLPVDGCVLLVIVFTMNLHHFLCTLLLQREVNHKPIATKYC